jgi:hypothetical protein
MTPETAGCLGTAEYAELVGRVHAAVTAVLPAGAALLVLSKGDTALLEIPGFAAEHFPQDASGDYAGHHPLDSDEAIARLEELRRRGAEYLVIPATALWWLDFYTGFAEHLARRGELVSEVAGTCRIFDIGRRASAAVATGAEATPQTSVAQMRDYLENLLSTDTRVVVLETGGGLAAALAPVQAAELMIEELQADGQGPLDALRCLVAGGADYLIVPRSADEWLESHADVSVEIGASCRKIADQRHLCRVFELKGPWAQA